MLDWADWSHDGALILGTGGCLYRQPMPRSLADAPEIRSLVADLNGQSFERVLPPADMRRWPEKLGWGKRQGRSRRR